MAALRFDACNVATDGPILGDVGNRRVVDAHPGAVVTFSVLIVFPFL
jgi:hypothetical protein